MCSMCKSYIKTDLVVEYFKDCEQHGGIDGFERDWDLESKDAEVMAEIE